MQDVCICITLEICRLYFSCLKLKNYFVLVLYADPTLPRHHDENILVIYARWNALYRTSISRHIDFCFSLSIKARFVFYTRAQ